MKETTKPIYFTKHSKTQIKSRNTSEKEVEKVIRTASWQWAEKGRRCASRVFPFNAKHYGRFYPGKEVVPIVEESDRIIVITVYTFFSQRRQ